MASKRMLRCLFNVGSKGLRNSNNCHEATVLQSRSFFGGRDPFPPFPDFKELERNSREITTALEKFGNSLGIPTPGRFRQMPIQGVAGDAHRISMDLSGFKPEDVNISLNGRVLTIQAKMEEKSADGSRFTSQSIFNSYTLPENVDLNGVKSLLSEDGILSIEMPLKGVEKKKTGPKEIPIQKVEDSPQG